VRRRTTTRPKKTAALSETDVPAVTRPAEAAAALAPEPTGISSEFPSSAAAQAYDAIDREEIARLAYSYWEARGGEGGSAEEDWLRAEQELRRRRAAL